MKKAVQFGAGNIGRGFLADLFTSSGYEVIFVEVNKKIVEALNQNKSYTLEFAKIPPAFKVIQNVRAVWSEDRDTLLKECWDCDILSTAVGKSNLPSIAEKVSWIIKERKKREYCVPFNLLICENVAHGSRLFKELLYPYLNEEEREFACHYLGLVETVIARMVPVIEEEKRKKDPLYIKVEDYHLLPADKKAFKGDIPSLRGLKPVENIKAWEDRKLYIHNLGHAIFAYLGYLKKYHYIYEGVEDKWIKEICLKVWDECRKGLIRDYGFKEKELQEHQEDLLQRFSNRALGDTVYRVARDPIRKLGPEERLIGGLRYIQKHKGNFEPLTWAAASALLYDYPEDKEACILQERIKREGIVKILQSISQLDPKEEATRLIQEKYSLLKNKFLSST